MKRTLTLFIILLGPLFSFSQGKIVINEFMPWTSNTCGGPTAEFVELLNFGPGPMNIGCYILTDGDFAITIPPNTILQPGQFYVISGQTIIPGPCANIDSTITTDLNWNTCNCTSGAIPTTGDGLFTDGGSASEQVVLLSPSLIVVDAVIRTLPAEPSAAITTSTLGGQCTARTFDLDLMGIVYETIGESAGRGNSFARKLDGDCGWVKDPQQSADATNNTPSEVSDIDYDFAVTNTTACHNSGSVAIIVNASNYSTIFPMHYTLAYDTDDDYLFELTDSYTTGIVNTPNTITVNGLVAGNYRITVESVNGCFLHTFPFTILACGMVLPLTSVSFSAARDDKDIINSQWSIQTSESIDHVVLEASVDGYSFISLRLINAPVTNNGMWNASSSLAADPLIRYMRLHIFSASGKQAFSRIVQLDGGEPLLRLWPNPAKEKLFITINKTWAHQALSYSIFNTMNQLVAAGEKMMDGAALLPLPVSQLPEGNYQVMIRSKNGGGKPLCLRFIKL